jgi:hypothetical protein
MSETIILKGWDHLEAKLKRIAGGMHDMRMTATQKAVIYVHGEVPPYPPAPPTSTYIRTGTLGRSITTEVRELGSQIVGVIGSDVVYAPWVISDEAVGDAGPQAKAHRGRWYTLQGVVRKAKNAIVNIYLEELRNLLRS